MSIDDPIDDLWDEIHPRPLTLPSEISQTPIHSIRGLKVGLGAHLVLAENPQELRFAIERIRSLIPPQSVTMIDSKVPCLIYGNDCHWRTIEKELETLFSSGRQAFIGTMNTFVMDCFSFESVADVQSRILRATKEGFIYRLSDTEASSFYSAYETGIQHVSEILRTDGFW